MRMRRWGLAVIALTWVGTPSPTLAQTNEAGVRRAALDYLEGFYEGDQDKIRRGVHPEVVKYGFDIPEAGADYAGSSMSFQEMLDYAAWVSGNDRQRPAGEVKEVEIYDVLDQTAVVKVTAFWGSDYLQMARYDGQWKIIHVLWQSPPRD